MNILRSAAPALRNYLSRAASASNPSFLTTNRNPITHIHGGLSPFRIASIPPSPAVGQLLSPLICRPTAAAAASLLKTSGNPTIHQFQQIFSSLKVCQLTPRGGLGLAAVHQFKRALSSLSCSGDHSLAPTSPIGMVTAAGRFRTTCTQFGQALSFMARPGASRLRPATTSTSTRYKTMNNLCQSHLSVSALFGRQSLRGFRPLPNPRPRFGPASAEFRRSTHVDCHYGARHRSKINPCSIVFSLFAIRCTILTLITGAAIGISLYYGKFETIPFTKRSHFIVVPWDLEQWLGREAMKEIRAYYWNKFLPIDHPDTLRVHRIASEIIYALPPDLKKHDWKVYVVKENELNAFCAPGGHIVVYTGLLDQFKSDAEIATVIGHEVGHALARHIAEAITKMCWFMMMKMHVMGLIYLPELVDLTTLLLLESPLSRRMEMEADRIGLLLLASAGYDPRDGPKVYRRLGQLTGEDDEDLYKASDADADGYDVGSFSFSTHPPGKERAEALSQDKVMDEALAIYTKVMASRGIKAISSPGNKSMGTSWKKGALSIFTGIRERLLSIVRKGQLNVGSSQHSRVLGMARRKHAYRRMRKYKDLGIL